MCIRDRVIREGQVSRPKVSYSFEGSEKTRTEKLKSSEIALAREELVLELSASRSTVNPGDKVNPVSYTHLDVYKRQPLEGGEFLERQERPGGLLPDDRRVV